MATIGNDPTKDPVRENVYPPAILSLLEKIVRQCTTSSDFSSVVENEVRVLRDCESLASGSKRDHMSSSEALPLENRCGLDPPTLRRYLLSTDDTVSQVSTILSHLISSVTPPASPQKIEQKLPSSGSADPTSSMASAPSKSKPGGNSIHDSTVVSLRSNCSSLQELSQHPDVTPRNPLSSGQTSILSIDASSVATPLQVIEGTQDLSKPPLVPQLPSGSPAPASINLALTECMSECVAPRAKNQDVSHAPALHTKISRVIHAADQAPNLEPGVPTQLHDEGTATDNPVPDPSCVEIPDRSGSQEAHIPHDVQDAEGNQVIFCPSIPATVTPMVIHPSATRCSLPPRFEVAHGCERCIERGTACTVRPDKACFECFQARVRCSQSKKRKVLKRKSSSEPGLNSSSPSSKRVRTVEAVETSQFEPDNPEPTLHPADAHLSPNVQVDVGNLGKLKLAQGEELALHARISVAQVPNKSGAAIALGSLQEAPNKYRDFACQTNLPMTEHMDNSAALTVDSLTIRQLTEDLHLAIQFIKRIAAPL